MDTVTLSERPTFMSYEHKTLQEFSSSTHVTGRLERVEVAEQKVQYRLGTVNSKSFVSKILLLIKWKFELTVYFKHEMLGK